MTRALTFQILHKNIFHKNSVKKVHGCRVEPLLILRFSGTREVLVVVSTPVEDELAHDVLHVPAAARGLEVVEGVVGEVVHDLVRDMHHVVAAVHGEVEGFELVVPGLVARRHDVVPGVVDDVADVLHLVFGEHDASSAHEGVHLFDEVIRQGLKHR